MSKASIGGMALQQRLVFSGALLRVPRAQAVFWPGCALLKLDPVILEKTMAVLSRQEPEIALATGCCGQPSAFLFPEKAAARREKLAGMLKKQGVRRIYTACPNCAKEMARLEGIEVIPIWAPLGRNLRAEDLAGTPGQFVLHDPCPMKNDPQRLAAVRVLLDLAGCDYTEPEHARHKTRCCGSAGMLRATDPQKSAALRRSRLAELDPGRTILSCCEGCLDAFGAEGRDTCHVLELLFGRSKTRSWANHIKSVLSRGNCN